MSTLGAAIAIEVPVVSAVVLEAARRTLTRHQGRLDAERRALRDRLTTQDDALTNLLFQVTPPNQPTLQQVLQQLHTDVEVIKATIGLRAPVTVQTAPQRPQPRA